MEKKKNDKYDLERKSPLFFAIGLIVALLCVTVAFEWRSEYDPVDLTANEDHFDPPIDIPITSFPKPEPPKPEKKVEYVKPQQIKDIVEIIDDLPQVVDTKNSIDLPLDDIPVEGPPIENPPPFFEGKIESMPEFPGGTDAFLKYVADHVKYPSRETRLGISGRVFIRFIIDEEGNLTDIEVIKGVSEGLDAEAVRVLENAPKWTPGKQRGRPVKFRMVLPITFSLNY